MQTYSHSGAVPLGGAVAALATAVVSAVVGGFLYAYAFAYIPIVHLNVLITVGFGLALGFAVAKVAEQGKVRNNLVVGFLGVLAAVMGLYIYWGAYYWALAGFHRIPEIGLYAFMPWGLVDMGTQLFQNGSWGLTEGNPVKGWFLVALWIIEAAVVVALAVAAARLNWDRPFCESCQQWTDSERGVARLSGTGREPAWEKVLGGDLPSLAEFQPSLPGSMQFIRLDVARCPHCATSRFLTIASVTVTIDQNRKPKETTRSLVKNAIVSPSQCAVVEACGQLYRQALDASFVPPDSAEAGDPASDAEEGPAS